MSKTFSKLGKSKLSAMVSATAATGCVLGSDSSINGTDIVLSTCGTFLCSLSANTLNQLQERFVDAKMHRTAHRPLPAALCSTRSAGAFALLSGAAGIATLWYSNGRTTAASLGAGNIGLYACVYTPMKRISVANTWVGAIVGAVPPLIGWSVAANGSLQPYSQSGWLASVLYFWQMPHFMALAHIAREDYNRGGFRMLTQLDPSGARAAAVSLRNSAAMVPLGYLAYSAGVASLPLAFECAAISAGIIVLALRFHLAPSQQSAKALFKGGLLQLPLLMVAAVVHRIPQAPLDERTLDEREMIADHRFHSSMATLAPKAAFFAKSNDRRPSAVESVLLLCSAAPSTAAPYSASATLLQEAPFPFLPLPGESATLSPHQTAQTQQGLRSDLQRR